jgi:hypothetical protein
LHHDFVCLVTESHEEDVSYESLMTVIAGLGGKGWELVTATDAVSPSEPFALRHVQGFGPVAGLRTQHTDIHQTRRPVPVK